GRAETITGPEGPEARGGTMTATEMDVGFGAKVEERARGLDLDALARMDVAALDALYRRGTTPADLSGLEGHPRGRMLAIRSLDGGGAFRAIRRFAGAAVFPWGGKSFSGRGVRGTGINRVHLGGRHQLFPFHTDVRPSVIDQKPCIALDYDLPDNPALIR